MERMRGGSWVFSLDSRDIALSGCGVAGRQVANAALISAVANFSGGLRILSDDPVVIRDCEKLAGKGPSVEPVRLAEIGSGSVVFRLSPHLGALLKERQNCSTRTFSLVGLTHSMATGPAVMAIRDLLDAPIQPWDALICTSESTRVAVRKIMDFWSRDFHEEAVATPVIPLGVDSAVMAREEAKRALGRRELRLSNQDVCVLSVGRLDYATKADPRALFLAVRGAMEKTGRRVKLLMVGRFPSREMRSAFERMAGNVGVDEAVVFLDSRHQETRVMAWNSADIFCGLSDNIQESFGLAPLEAMSYGLPAIVSDWSGHRDTIRDGTDGFLIPTLFPPLVASADFPFLPAESTTRTAHRLLAISQATVVDVDAATAALIHLIEREELRRTMAENARARVIRTFDWRHTIRRLARVASDLVSKQASAPERVRENVWNLSDCPIPIRAFSGNASRQLTGDEKVTWRAERFAVVNGSAQDRELIADKQEWAIALRLAAQGVTGSLNELSEGRPGLMRVLAHFAKMGAVKLER